MIHQIHSLSFIPPSKPFCHTTKPHKAHDCFAIYAITSNPMVTVITVTNYLHLLDTQPTQVDLPYHSSSKFNTWIIYFICLNLHPKKTMQIIKGGPKPFPEGPTTYGFLVQTSLQVCLIPLNVTQHHLL